MAIVQADVESTASKEFPRPRPDISFHAFGDSAALFDPALRRVFVLRPAEAVAWCLFSEAGGQVATAASALAAASSCSLAEARSWLETALVQWAAADLLGTAPPPVQASVPESPRTEAAAIPGAPAELRRYRLLDIVIEVAFPGAGIAMTADAVLGVVRSDAPALAEAALVRDGHGWKVVVDGYVAERASRPSQAIPALKLALARLALSRATGVGAVHAAALACDRGAVLLPAPAGSGKSTLAAGCALAGWELVADDTVVLDGPPDNALLLPLPLASCLKPGSWAPLTALGADLESLAIHERLDGRRARYLAPALPANGPRTLAAIVLVRWKAGGRCPARLVPLSPLQAFEALAPRLYPLDRPFDAALVGLRRNAGRANALLRPGIQQAPGGHRTARASLCTMMPPRYARLLGAVLAGNEAVGVRGLAALDAAGWTGLLRVAGEDLLTPELAAPLAAPAYSPLVPPEVASHIAALRALNAARNERIAAQAAEMIPAFAAAGLCPLLLKGARAFADPEPGRADRVTGDLDLLFQTAEMDAAAVVLERLGYRSSQESSPGPHVLGYFVRAGEPAPVDLHREALRLPHLLSARELFGRARPASAFGASVWLADAVDEVLHRALHETVQHQAYRFGVASVRSLRNIAVRLPGLGPDDWAELRSRTIGRSLVPVATALRLVQDVFGSQGLGPEAAAIANHPLARVAAWRTWAKAAAMLPSPVDGVWGVAVGGLGAYEYRPGMDGSLSAWRARRLGHALRRAFRPSTPQ